MKPFKNLTVGDLDASVKNDVVNMIFGEVSDVDANLASFTSGSTNSPPKETDDIRQIVWKDGNSRFPHINRVTGFVALYENPDIIKFGLTNEVISAFKEKYESEQVIYAHGPPIVAVKPQNSGKSTGMIFLMNDITPEEKYTGIVSLSHEKSGENTGELEILSQFDVYYDVLNAFFNFGKHTKSKDVLYLEKWFNLADANEIIEEYTQYYNYYERGIPCTLTRKIRREVVNIYKKNKFVVPAQCGTIRWESLSSRKGELYMISSKQPIRSLQNKDSVSRVYMYIAMQSKPANWDQSKTKISLLQGYKTGKWGNWGKPGLRLYIRENSSEYSWRRVRHNGEKMDVLTLPAEKREILGI